MADATLPHEQLELILEEIMRRARDAIELDRHLLVDNDIEVMMQADSDKLKTIAFIGWLADVGLTRMGSCMRQHDGDPIKWMLSQGAAGKLAMLPHSHGDGSIKDAHGSGRA